MRITRIAIHQVDLPLKEGAYSWSTQCFAAFDSTVLIIETDGGVTGVGEVCPLGPSYLPAYAEGARAGLAHIGRGLIGEDPLQVGRINQRMSLGIAMTIEDTWGGEIATAAIAHLAHSTPEGFHFQSSAFHEYHSLQIATGGPAIQDGYMVAPSAPGLGVTPDPAVLGKPVCVIQE